MRRFAWCHRVIARRRGQTDNALRENWQSLRKALHIEQAVRSQEADADAGAVKAFLVSNDRWLAGMRVLHAEAIKPIWKKYENHSIWDTDLGLQGSPAYEDAVRKVRNDALAAEAEELAKRAGLA